MVSKLLTSCQQTDLFLLNVIIHHILSFKLHSFRFEMEKGEKSKNSLKIICSLEIALNRRLCKLPDVSK